MGFGAKGKWDGVKKAGWRGGCRGVGAGLSLRHCGESEAIHISVHAK